MNAMMNCQTITNRHFTIKKKTNCCTKWQGPITSRISGPTFGLGWGYWNQPTDTRKLTKHWRRRKRNTKTPIQPSPGIALAGPLFRIFITVRTKHWLLMQPPGHGRKHEVNTIEGKMIFSPPSGRTQSIPPHSEGGGIFSTLLETTMSM